MSELSFVYYPWPARTFNQFDVNFEVYKLLSAIKMYYHYYEDHCVLARSFSALFYLMFWFDWDLFPDTFLDLEWALMNDKWALVVPMPQFLVL